MKFHAQRRMFAVVGNEVFIGMKYDPRSHQEWLGFGYSLLRGYADVTGLYFYSTQDCRSRVGDWETMQRIVHLLVGPLGLTADTVIWEGTVRGMVGEMARRQEQGKLC